MIHWTTPQDYGFSPANVTAELQELAFDNGTLSAACPGRQISCLASLPVDTILDAQDELVAAASGIEGVPLVERESPILAVASTDHAAWPSALRPTIGPATLPADFHHALLAAASDSTLAPVPLMITSTRSEAAQLVSALFPSAPGDAAYAYALIALVGPDRAQKVQSIPCYDLANATSVKEARAPFAGDVDAPRAILSRLVTDAGWRCPARQVAAAWTGGRVWVGEW